MQTGPVHPRVPMPPTAPDPLDPGPAQERRSRTFRSPLTSPGKIIALAIVANLLIAGSVAAAVAPVETSGAALSFYDSMPDWLGIILGDEDGGDGGIARGWLGSWLNQFHMNAVRGDPKAQLGMDLELEAEREIDTWTATDTLHLSWTNYGATLTYRLAVTDDEQAETPMSDPVVVTTDTNATVPLRPGENWVHVQPVHRDRSGPVTTMGPFLSDPDPPTPPEWIAIEDKGLPDGIVEVSSYQFVLEWSEAQARSGIATYHLERRSGPSSSWEGVATLDVDNRTLLERNRPNGLYDYRVRAESTAGVVSPDGPALRVRVDAQGSLEPPGLGEWHYGVNANYDSVIHLWDISDPELYSTVDEIHAGQAGLTADDAALYTDSGWGITLDNQTLRQVVADELGGEWQGGELVGGERNTLEIGLALFEWMFDEVDYDFEKRDGTDFDLLRANEVVDAEGGICGDLTALFVTLMRIAGVPARPVHGYLINNEGAPGQNFDQEIGGFHMWPEIYVGGEAVDGPGDGWMPIDVSGVTGDFKPEYLHLYFGVSNPNYLQLGVQTDLGDESLEDDHERNRWNVWANLRHWSVGPAHVDFHADAILDEHEREVGNLWFTPGTNERVWCPQDDEECRGSHTTYYQGIKGRSVRSIDFGAEITWSGDVHELKLTMRYPLQVGPTQVVMWTAYERDPQCNVGESDPRKTSMDSLEWTIPGGQEPCSP